jgi:hypothetical protein
VTAPEPPRPADGQPAVQTAPAQSGHWWSSVPRHLGRARTSTIVLVLLWVAIFVLYIFVRPEPAVTGASTTGNPNTGVQQPAPRRTVAPPTTAHPTTTPPTTTPPHPSPTETSPTTSPHTTSPTGTGTFTTTPPATTAGPSLPGSGNSSTP